MLVTAGLLIFLGVDAGAEALELGRELAVRSGCGIVAIGKSHVPPLS